MNSVIDWLRANLKTGRIAVLAMLGLGGLAIGLIFLTRQSQSLSSPEAIARQYLSSLYAQDYSRAYDFISAADQAHKSREEYIRESNGFTGFSLEASRQLASYIEYPEIETDGQGDHLIVTVQFIVPDGNAPAVKEILSAPSQSSEVLSDAERSTLLKRLDDLHDNGQIPTIEGEQSFELVKEETGWRIFENWAEGVQVHFSGEVKDGLPWEFEPLQDVVIAKPGETLQTVYRVKNLADQTVIAKARHMDKPEEYLEFLDIIQCFCFLQQTLRPGEEAELPLVFRVEWDVPEEVSDFYVHYELYPIDSFPEE